MKAVKVYFFFYPNLLLSRIYLFGRSLVNFRVKKQTKQNKKLNNSVNNPTDFVWGEYVMFD